MLHSFWLFNDTSQQKRLKFACDMSPDTASLSWLYTASTAFTIWKFLGVSYCAGVTVPRALRAQRAGGERRSAGHEIAGRSDDGRSRTGGRMAPRLAPIGARFCDSLLFGEGRRRRGREPTSSPPRVWNQSIN